MKEKLQELIAKWRSMSCSRDKYYFNDHCPDCRAYLARADELEAALAASEPQQAVILSHEQYNDLVRDAMLWRKQQERKKATK